MADKHSGIRLAQEGDGFRLWVKEGAIETSALLNLGVAADFLCTLGLLMNATNARLGDNKDAGQTQSAIYLDIRQMAVTTVKETVYLSIAFRNFPTIRLQIPDGSLKAAGEAFLELASAPVEFRTQKTN